MFVFPSVFPINLLDHYFSMILIFICSDFCSCSRLFVLQSMANGDSYVEELTSSFYTEEDI